LETMESLLEELPDHPYIYYLILEQHFSMGQLDEAIKYLNRALENIKGDQQIYIFAGLIYSAQQKLAEVLLLLQQSLEYGADEERGIHAESSRGGNACGTARTRHHYAFGMRKALAARERDIF